MILMQDAKNTVLELELYTDRCFWTKDQAPDQRSRGITKLYPLPSVLPVSPLKAFASFQANANTFQFIIDKCHGCCLCLGPVFTLSRCESTKIIGMNRWSRGQR